MPVVNLFQKEKIDWMNWDFKTFKSFQFLDNCGHERIDPETRKLAQQESFVVT